MYLNVILFLENRVHQISDRSLPIVFATVLPDHAF